MQQVRFEGALLERGFWLYVWRVRQESREVLYVGRTGDSSSRFAASPFSRLSQHLDIRPKAVTCTKRFFRTSERCSSRRPANDRMQATVGGLGGVGPARWADERTRS